MATTSKTRTPRITPRSAPSRTPRKLRRLHPELSLRGLSRKTAIALPHLSRIFSGKRGLTVAMALRIARATDNPLQTVVDTLTA